MDEYDRKQTTQLIDNPNSSKSPLEARVTSVIDDPPTTYRDKICRQMAPKMSAVELLYTTVDELDISNFSSRLSSCRSEAFFVRHEDTGEVQVRSKHCGLRWCPLCSASRQAWITTEVDRWFKRVHKPRLLTLTLRHTNAPLEHQIKHLYNYFRKFRKRKYLRDRIKGGVWFFHIKKSNHDHKWHPHLHCLIDSEWLDYTTVSDLWCKTTYGSHVVHIKSVTNPENSVRHAARYSAEPCDVSGLNLGDGLEVYYALQGRRICGTWGTARKISFRPKPPPDSKSWHTVGTWDMVLALKDYDDNAQAIWKCYHLEQPLVKGVSMYTLEEELYYGFIRAGPKKFIQSFFNFAA